MGLRFRPSPDALTQQVGDEIVLVHLRTDRIFSLNPTGARIWELLSKDYSPFEIQERLLQDFEVDERQLKKELENLISSLCEQELLVISQE